MDNDDIAKRAYRGPGTLLFYVVLYILFLPDSWIYAFDGVTYIATALLCGFGNLLGLRVEYCV